MNMQLRFSLGMMPLKYRMQIQYVPALPCISPAEPIPGELLLSRAHFRFDSNTKFKRKNYIYKLSKKATTYSGNQLSNLERSVDTVLSYAGKVNTMWNSAD